MTQFLIGGESGNRATSGIPSVVPSSPAAVLRSGNTRPSTAKATTAWGNGVMWLASPSRDDKIAFFIFDMSKKLKAKSRNAVSSIVVFLLLLLVLVDLSCVAVAQEAQDLQFTATGVVDSQYYLEGSITDHLTNEFTCHVSKSRYSMVLTASNQKDKRTTSFECLFDGTNTYFTRRLSTNLLTTVSTIKNGQIFEKNYQSPCRRTIMLFYGFPRDQCRLLKTKRSHLCG